MDRYGAGILFSVRAIGAGEPVSVAEHGGHDLQRTNYKWRLGKKRRMGETDNASLMGTGGSEFRVEKSMEKHRHWENRIDEVLWRRSSGNRD
jgi:hypothetical protein